VNFSRSFLAKKKHRELFDQPTVFVSVYFLYHHKDSSQVILSIWRHHQQLKV